YHSGISSTHPYSSRWYEWVLDIRPILYYLEYDGDMRSSFGAFLNPLVCWMGLAAMLFMVYLVAARRDKRALFILVGYLAQLVPWVFVTRTTYEYHYFPSMVFLVLAIGRVFAEMRDHLPRWRRPVFGFTAVCTALFVMFYPVLSGAWIPAQYGAYFLKWLPRWPF
ncbi:MAG: dolichyl-phosphate-mannose--protein mannosyltransferase, partial [Oscillospiraceae bacterium]|nr:dolichyl-phosphate-mannose--protein mannosyltransferase [Oscillospiraceae bacterium]